MLEVYPVVKVQTSAPLVGENSEVFSLLSNCTPKCRLFTSIREIAILTRM